MTTSERIAIATSVAEILGQIHAEGIVDKDINRRNILLEPKSGRIKIIDFGIWSDRVLEIHNFANRNVIEGTLVYISPEQTGRVNPPIDYR